LAGWVDTCAITECYNKCTMTESCTVDWTYDLDEHVGDDTCENFSEWLVDNCDIAHVIERDCTDQATAAGLEMETCVYTDVLDQCTMEYTDCYVAFDNPFTHEADEADCWIFEGLLEPINQCEYECTTEVDCMENPLTEDCLIVECISPCEHFEIKCWAEWTDADGET